MKDMGEADFLRYLMSMRSSSASPFSQGPVGLPTNAFQPPAQMASAAVEQPQQPTPLPPQRPVQQAAQAVPLPRPSPVQPSAQPPASPMSFSGAKGPQWTDEQWQNYWGRSSPDGLMSYYPVQE